MGGIEETDEADEVDDLDESDGDGEVDGLTARNSLREERFSTIVFSSILTMLRTHTRSRVVKVKGVARFDSSIIQNSNAVQMTCERAMNILKTDRELQGTGIAMRSSIDQTHTVAPYVHARRL